MFINATTFVGFRPELLTFLKGLSENNTREWFQAHRAEYEAFLLEPARAFVVAMGDQLSTLGSDIHAEPKVHGSIFAINRDTRFSADKTPYKTHLDLWFWQGTGPASDRNQPGYFFRLTPESLILGAGMHAFSEQVSHSYRQAILDDAWASCLEEIADAIGREHVHGQTYKRVPAGLPSDHPRADWLKHSGLFADVELQPVPEQLFSDQAVQLCFEHFRRLAPLQQWLVDLLRAD